MMLEQILIANIPSREMSGPLTGDRVEILRRRINDEDYLHAAIQRLALVMSNELMDISKEGGCNERKRRK
ncbi:MAG: hypothetical protein FWB83_03810 [Treponema sp.]|nr:hypothetical protein [Treponema sp.]